MRKLIVAAVLGVAVVAGSATACSAAPAATPQIVIPAPAAVNIPTPPSSYTFKMTSTGAVKAGSIAYSLDGTSAQASDVPLPWSKTMPTNPTPTIYGPPASQGTMTIETPFEDTSAGTITCTITDDKGNVVDTHSFTAEGGEGSSTTGTCQTLHN